MKRIGIFADIEIGVPGDREQLSNWCNKKMQEVSNG